MDRKKYVEKLRVKSIKREVIDDGYTSNTEQRNLQSSIPSANKCNQFDTKKLLQSIHEQIDDDKNHITCMQRVSKIDWTKIDTNKSVKECKENLRLIVSNIPKYRTLCEVLSVYAAENGFDQKICKNYGKEKRNTVECNTLIDADAVETERRDLEASNQSAKKWKRFDTKKLLQSIHKQIDDDKNHITCMRRVSIIDWTKIDTNKSVKECKEDLRIIVSNIPKYRTLGEVLSVYAGEGDHQETSVDVSGTASTTNAAQVPVANRCPLTTMKQEMSKAEVTESPEETEEILFQSPIRTVVRRKRGPAIRNDATNPKRHKRNKTNKSKPSARNCDFNIINDTLIISTGHADLVANIIESADEEIRPIDI